MIKQIFSSKIGLRIMTSFIILILAALAILGFTLQKMSYEYNLYKEQTSLSTNGILIKNALSDYLYNPEEKNILLKHINAISEETGLRITIILADGTVIADSAQSPSDMTNHLNREEVAAILRDKQESAYAIRASSTMDYQMMYVALPIYNNSQLWGVVRTASDITPLEEAQNNMERGILFSLLLAGLIALILSLWLTQKIYSPIKKIIDGSAEIAAGSLNKKLILNTKDELAQLASTINALTDSLNQKLATEKEQNLKLASLLEDVSTKQADFITNAAHELATPLTSISGFAETLLEETEADTDPLSQEQRKKFLSIIYKEAGRMSRLVKNLLQLARMDKQDFRQQLPMEYIDCREVLTEAKNQLMPQILEHQHQVLLRLAQEECIIYANRDLLSQIFINLLENAIKYTDNGGEIILSCSRELTQIIISFQDNGIGIPPSQQGRIFERFYRVDKAHSRSTGGNGIGLSMVQFFVRLFDGKISLVSKLYQGSCFTLSFPQGKKSLNK